MGERTQTVAGKALLQAILQSASDYAIVAVDLTGRVTFWNDGAERVLGWSAADAVGRPVAMIFTAPDQQAGVPEAEMREARETGCAADERWHARKDGRVFWASGRLTPLHDPEGALIGYLKILRDRTEARLARESREVSARALRLSEARLRLALEAGRMAVWEVDGEITSISSSPELNPLLGFPPGYAPTTEEIRALYLPGESQRLRAAAFAAMARGERFLEDEISLTRADTGEPRTFQLRMEALYRPDGTPERLLGVIIDITEQKRAEERRRLLLEEMNHRVKNTLAVVQSMVVLALRRAESVAQAEAALTARLKALAAAHDVLTQADWSGAALGEVVRGAIDALGGDGRFRLAGPPVQVSADAALALSLALQELATNAAKYGALSTEAGTVEIVWTAEEGCIHLTWRERGGPPAAAPERCGFGTRLLQRVVEHDLGGRLALDWAPQGLTAEIEAPLE